MRPSRRVGLPLLAAAVTLAAWILAGGVGWPSSVVSFTFALLFLGWLLLCLAAVIATLVYGCIAVRRRGIAAFGLAAAVFAGLILGLIGSFPVSKGVGEVVWEAQRPAREALAEELIAKAEADQLDGEQVVHLTGQQAWLSDDSEVLVYGDGIGACVWYWDVCGLLGDYTASVYVADVDAVEAPGITLSYNGSAVHEAGHWWSSDGSD